MSKYDFTPEMGEISGFGGDYEARCRGMLRNGLEWLDEHPNAKPKLSRLKSGDIEFYGIVREENDDAKALSKAVTESGAGCSGAMHQAVMESALWIHKFGWDAYVKQMSVKAEPLDLTRTPRGKGKA